jgi:hypothetical protein
VPQCLLHRFGHETLVQIAASLSQRLDEGDSRERNLFTRLALVYVGVVASVGAFLFWSSGIKGTGAARSSVFLNLIPSSPPCSPRWPIAAGNVVAGARHTGHAGYWRGSGGSNHAGSRLTSSSETHLTQS